MSTATRDAYGEALAAIGGRDPRVVVLDADLSGSTKTAVFAKAYPERFFNFGVAEQNMMGAAAGLARQGKIPFASTFAIFATGRAFEPIRQQIAYANLNAKVVASHGGVTVGEDGGSHQTVEDLALMRALPNMTVLCPADAEETKQATAAIHAHEGPVYMRTGRMKVPDVFTADYRFQLGKAAQLGDGGDVTIVTTGLMAAAALEAAKILANQGIHATILHCATIKPIDVDAIVAAATRTRAVVSAEEHSVIGALGSAVAEVLAEHAPTPLERVGLRDVFGQSGTGQELLDYYNLNAAGIVAAVERVLKRT